MAAYDLDWPGQRRAFDGVVAEEGAEFDDREVVPPAGSLILPILRTLAITRSQGAWEENI